ncbi:hypothetical protein BaRGS_00004193, partial [Batillaria attramentaria]
GLGKLGLSNIKTQKVIADDWDAADVKSIASHNAFWRQRHGRGRNSRFRFRCQRRGGRGRGCCEGGRILGTNPHTGQPVCSCQYSPGLLTYSRVAAGLSDSVYPTSPYGTPGYVPFGTDPSAFYPPLTSAYDLKEAGDTWRGISQPAACYPYDPTGMSTYPYTNAAPGATAWSPLPDIPSSLLRSLTFPGSLSAAQPWADHMAAPSVEHLPLDSVMARRDNLVTM